MFCSPLCFSNNIRQMVFAGKHFLNSSLAVPKNIDGLTDGCFCQTKGKSLTYVYGSIEFRQNYFGNCSLKIV